MWWWEADEKKVQNVNQLNNLRVLDLSNNQITNIPHGVYISINPIITII